MKHLFNVVAGVALVGIAYGVLDQMMTYGQGACLASILVIVAAGKMYLDRNAASTASK